MEPSAKYALYHATDPASLKWAAKIRLTPELLAKLQDGSVADDLSLTFSADKTEPSVLRVGDEAFELLTYPEDASVNHLCTLSPEDDGRGYSFYETGRIAKKLIVQRLLDSTEKDRLKDRHAKSVEDYKSRSSKLLEDKPTRGERKRTRTVIWQPDTPAVAIPEKPLTAFASALTSDQLEAITHEIAKKIEVEPVLKVEPAPKIEAKPAPKIVAELPKVVEAASVEMPKAKAKATPKPKATLAKISSPVQRVPATVGANEPPSKAVVNVASSLDLPVPALVPRVPETTKLIRAKRRVLSPAVHALSTFTPDMETIFKKYSATRPLVAAIANESERVACEATLAEHVAAWTLLEKSYSIEVVLTNTKAITGAPPNAKYAQKHELREEGIATVKALMDHLLSLISTAELAIASFKTPAMMAENDDGTL
ncbi:hypothetical protein SPRG_00625 [Saprolegnia parasitica CBS 223.65]|uniref:Uncharacterized protein n=1 Tax=Saprolegnia parasitica (strain CBS 223.65) TaxID=695850 RepID=A0A067D6C6_SAPPC|nr:hypothetical protein SPRG_00625 [Saprolegnia parasitica CBS 223.65]KDO34562.1 hypothetical protein SPRG_00625 [Saprolegnia parasitica CBS 223.65]|eukprot:XP_012194239.1 hypothetical protein SPRG_00625 [Saprolegnia parasitica CBS 223.65]